MIGGVWHFVVVPLTITNSVIVLSFSTTHSLTPTLQNKIKKRETETFLFSSAELVSDLSSLPPVFGRRVDEISV